MRAIVCDDLGPLDRLRLAEVPDPAPGPGQVLIDVQAARVLASCGLGGYAEKVVVPARAAVAIPDRLDAPRAATFTQSYSTMLYALTYALKDAVAALTDLAERRAAGKLALVP